MKVTVILFLIILASAQHFGVDRMFGDLPGYPVKISENPSWDKCEKLCNENSECEMWAYGLPNCPATVEQDAQCWLKKGDTKLDMNPCRISGVKDIDIRKPAFKRVRLGDIVPNGWMKNWLDLQANSLSGSLYKFWHDIQQSSWLGGNGDTDLHERFPYWMNGIIPLAYELNNTELIKEIETLVSFILDNQQENGWIGPDDNTSGDQYWSRFPMTNALFQYHEFNKNDERVIPAIKKLYREIFRRMFKTPMGDSWAAARWADLVYVCQLLLDTETDRSERQFIYDLSELARKQGFDWDAFYQNDIPKDSTNDINLHNHGVNNAQGLKGCAVAYRMTKDDSYNNKCKEWVNTLMTYHGQAYGLFAADEHFGGHNPVRGTELCTVVEWVESMNIIGSVLGDSTYFDYAEKAIYNAFPATLTPDMWTHQYIQEANQVQAKHMEHRPWVSDGDDAHTFGFDIHFGCCTANFNQGLPKFVRSIIMKADDGYVISLYGAVHYTDSEVMIDVQTIFPFEDDLHITVDSKKNMLLYIRKQGYSEGMTVTMNGEEVKLSVAEQKGFYSFEVSEGVSKITVHNEYKIRVEKRFNDAVAIYRGALLFTLPVGESRTITHTYYKDVVNDYQMTNTTSWNYGLSINWDEPEKSCEYRFVSQPDPIEPFSMDHRPVELVCKGAKINWDLNENAVAVPPQSPVDAISDIQEVILVPYGSTDLHLTEIPYLK